MLQLSKRHPVYSKRVDSNDGAVKTDDTNGDQEARAGILCKVCKVFVKMFWGSIEVEHWLKMG